MDQSKRCRKCDVVKSLDGFHRQASSKDGRQPYCRECNSRVAAQKKTARKAVDPEFVEHLRQYRAGHYQDHREEQKAAARAWREANPARVAATQAAYLVNHPERRADTHRRYREANADKRREAFRAWAQANPEMSRIRQQRRRAHKRSVLTVPFSVDQLSSRLAYFGGRCWMCGDAASTLDHVKPISLGGAHVLANLRPACGACNSRKQARWFGVAGLHKFIK